MKENIVGWVEIPVIDMDRAINFYENLLEIKIRKHQVPGLDLATFPEETGKPGCGGMLIKHEEFYIPDATKGSLIYFNCEDVEKTLKRAKASGTEILRAKTKVSDDFGYVGLLLDSEGNRIGLRST